MKLAVRRRVDAEWPVASGCVTVISTGALGYLGATEEDRLRWLGAFRRALDGLQAPLQVVMQFQPGLAEPDEPQVSPARFSRRSADLAFARDLARGSSAQHRSVRLVTSRPAGELLLEALNQMGLRQVASRSLDRGALLIAGEERPEHFIDHDGWHRSWWVERLPGFELEPGWLGRIVPAAQRLTLAYHVTSLPAGWVVDYLQRQLRAMRATRMGGSGRENPALETALPNAESLQQRIAANQESAFRASVYLTASAANRNALEAASERVEASAQASLVSLQRCTFRMRQARVATMPIGVDPLHRERVLDTSSLATFFPWLDADLRQETGLLLGTSRATGCPVLLDPFDDARYANANLGVFGHSGAGKTYLLSSLALGSLGLDVQVFVIDPEEEYLDLAKRAGGAAVRLALGSGHALNVLELRPETKITESWLGPAVADAIELTSVICGGLDETERVVLERAVRDAYASEAHPVLRNVAERLPAGGRVGSVLLRWVSGALGAMFSAPTNVDLDAPIVAFGMRELREEMVGPVHYLLAEALWSRIKNRQRRRLLMIDELGLLFEDPTLRRFVVNLARRIRKYDGALVFATQNPGDLLSSEAGSVVATNPATLFFGAQRPGEAAKLQRAFQLSDAQRTGLEVAKRGEFLLAAGSDRLPIQVRTAPWQHELIAGSRPRGGT